MTNSTKRKSVFSKYVSRDDEKYCVCKLTLAITTYLQYVDTYKDSSIGTRSDRSCFTPAEMSFYTYLVLDALDTEITDDVFTIALINAGLIKSQADERVYMGAFDEFIHFEPTMWDEAKQQLQNIRTKECAR